MLEIKNLSKKFGKKTVLNNIDYTFENGIYGLLGPNGSGKTTLIRAITGLYSVSKNTVIFNSVDTKNNKEFLSAVGYLPQSFGMFKELTVREMLTFFANIKGISKNDSEKDIVNTLKLVNLSDKIDSKVSKLSGGMIRRAGIAQALLGNPKVIIFDEPTVGLDPEERLRFKNIISNLPKDKVIIISTHIVEDVEALCEKIIIMNTGKILVSGTTQEIEKLAYNKVYLLPQSELSNVKSKYVVQKQYTEDGANFARILSESKLEYRKPELTIEDGYMYAIKKSEKIF